jgi:pyruvate kinase
MLSGETAVGRFPVETVVMMDRIIRSTEEMGVPARETMRRAGMGSSTGSFGRAIAEAANFAAEEIDCRLIVVISQSGHMARRIAALRPRQRIIALTPVESSCRKLAASWGVEPYLLEAVSPESTQLLAHADEGLLRYELAERGENVIVMAGRFKDRSISLSMKIHQVGDLAERR